jgi:hypothetical protein
MGFIGRDELLRLGKELATSEYGSYILSLVGPG